MSQVTPGGGALKIKLSKKKPLKIIAGAPKRESGTVPMKPENIQSSKQSILGSHIDASRRGYKSDSDSGSEDDRYRSRSRDDSRSRSRSRGRSSKPCTYCHKPNHDFSHCYKLARELRKLCTGEKRNKGDKEEEARLNMLSCVKNYFESEKDSTN